MKRYELEILGKLTWKFTSEEEVLQWALRLMMGSLSDITIYRLDTSEKRVGIDFTLHKDGQVCEYCRAKGEVVTISRVNFEKLKKLTCRKCGMTITKPPVK